MNASACPPDLILEEHLVGELPPGSRYASHVLTCALCADRLAAMRSAGAAYMESDAAKSVRSKLEATSRKASRGRLSPWWWSSLAPAAAAAAWLLLARSPPPEDLVAKGSSTVQLLVGHEGQVAPWTGGALATGDALQLSWTSGQPGYVAVIARESSGTTTRLFPAGDHAERLEPGTRTFGDSLRFDPQFSGTIYVLVADSPFPTESLESAIAEGRAPALHGKTLTLRVP